MKNSPLQPVTKLRITTFKSIKLHMYVVFILFAVFNKPAISLAQEKVLPVAGTHAVLGNIDGVNVEVMTQSPSEENTPLQIACVFEYTDNDIFTPPALPAAANGMVHLDEGLSGIITDLRKSGRFAGHAFETLLIEVPNGVIKPKKLLLIGLGDRRNFEPEMMKTVGAIGMREALRLGVNSYAHASDLKDGGVDSPTGLIAANVLKGAMDAYTTQVYLKNKNLSTCKPMKKITFLAGPPFYDITADALKKAINLN